MTEEERANSLAKEMQEYIATHHEGKAAFLAMTIPEDQDQGCCFVTNLPTEMSLLLLKELVQRIEGTEDQPTLTPYVDVTETIQ